MENNPVGTATRGNDCGLLHPRANASPTPRAHAPDNFKPAQPRMKKSEQGVPPLRAASGARVNANVQQMRSEPQNLKALAEVLRYGKK